MKKEKSCGLVVFKEDKVLIIQHNLGHYGLPKGHVEEKETEEETAIRETKEETNIDAKIITDFKKKITYSPKPNVIKDVIFFIGIPISFEIKCQENEVQKADFVSFKNALDLITHKEEKSVLKEAITYYQKNNHLF